MPYGEVGLSPGHRLSHFEIERLLGRGGMGEVYLAQDLKLRRRVALKILPPEFSSDPVRLARFHREATSAAALNHPHICTIHEVGEADGKTFIAMEYVEGETLRQHIGDKALPVSEALDYGIQIADALEQAREKGIVHRDIKSNNILLTPRHQIKILDFGLAKNVDVGLKKEGAAESMDVTATLVSMEASLVGTVLGTAPYMSPEQALGRDIDHRSDLFSFGVVLYEMLTGRLPFDGGTSQDVLGKILYDEAPQLSALNKNVPTELVQVINKLLAKKREERYQTARQALDALCEIKEALSLPSAAYKRAQAQARQKKRIRFLVAAGAIGVIGGFLLLAPWKKGLVPTAEAAALVALPSQVSGAQDFGYLAEAIPKTISAYLGQVEGLEIKMPPSSEEVDKFQRKLDKLAAAYDYKLKYFLVTSLMADSEKFLLNVQLMDAKTGRQVWSKPCEGSPKAYIALCRQAAEELRQFMRPSASPLSAAVGLSENSEAELAFHRGIYYSKRYNNGHAAADFDEAFSDFKKALGLDPKLADAAAEIAMLYEFKIEAGLFQVGSSFAHDLLPEIDSWASRSLAISQKCSKGWVARAAIEFNQPHVDWRKLLEFSLKAAFYSPQDSMAQLSIGIAFYTSPALSLAIPAYLESQRLDPLYLYAATGYSECLLALGDGEKALANNEKIVQIEPDHPLGLVYKGYALIQLNRMTEAADLLRKVKILALENKNFVAQSVMFQHLYDLRSHGQNSISADVEIVLKDVDNFQTTPFWLSDYINFFAPVLAQQGERGAALHIYEKGLDASLAPYDVLRLNPALKVMRGDPRFEKILAQAKAQFDESLTIIDQARARGEFPKYLEQPLADLLLKLGII